MEGGVSEGRRRQQGRQRSGGGVRRARRESWGEDEGEGELGPKNNYIILWDKSVNTLL